MTTKIKVQKKETVLEKQNNYVFDYINFVKLIKQENFKKEILERNCYIEYFFIGAGFVARINYFKVNLNKLIIEKSSCVSNKVRHYKIEDKIAKCKFMTLIDFFSEANKNNAIILNFTTTEIKDEFIKLLKFKFIPYNKISKKLKRYEKDEIITKNNYIKIINSHLSEKNINIDILSKMRNIKRYNMVTFSLIFDKNNSFINDIKKQKSITLKNHFLMFDLVLVN